MLKKCLKYTAMLLICCLFSVFCFKELLSVKQADAIVGKLPPPTALLKASEIVNYPALTGLKLNRNNPLQLDFILEGSDSDKFNAEYRDILLNIFLSAVTVPQGKFWVNLDPNEKDRIIDADLAQTDAGRLFLEQDYILKLFSSSLSSPDTETGKEYWDSILSISKTQTEDLLNKFWIVPQKAKLARYRDTVMIEMADLSVEQRSNKQDSIEQNLANSVLLKHIEQEVNNAENFALLRAFYKSFLLGLWYKDQLKGSFMDLYIDQSLIKGLDTQDPSIRKKIYSNYLESIQKGVYKTSREISDTKKRAYCAGGFEFADASYVEKKMSYADMNNKLSSYESAMGFSLELVDVANKGIGSSAVRRNSPRLIIEELNTILEKLVASNLLSKHHQEYNKLIEYINSHRSILMAKVFSRASEDALVKLSYVRWALESESLSKEDKEEYIVSHIENYTRELLGIELDEIDELNLSDTIDELDLKVQDLDRSISERQNDKTRFDLKTAKDLAGQIFGSVFGIFSKGARNFHMDMPKVISQSPLARVLSFGRGEGKLKGFQLGLSEEFKYLVRAEYDSFDYKSDEFKIADQNMIIERRITDLEKNENFRSLNQFEWDYWRNLSSNFREYYDSFKADLRRTIFVDLDVAEEKQGYYVLPSIAFDNKYLTMPLGIVTDDAWYVRFAYVNGQVLLNKADVDALGLEVVEFEYKLFSPELFKSDLKASKALEALKEDYPDLFGLGVDKIEINTSYDLGPIEDMIKIWAGSKAPNHLLVPKIEEYIKDYLFYAKGFSDWLTLIKTPAKYNYQRTLNSHLGVCHDANKIMFMILKKLGINSKYVVANVMKPGYIIDVGHSVIKYWSGEKQQWLYTDATPERLNETDVFIEEKVDESKLIDYLDPRFVNPHFFELATERFEIIAQEQYVNPDTRIVTINPVKVNQDDSYAIVPVSSKAGRLSYDTSGQLYLKINPDQYYNKVEVEYIKIPSKELGKGVAIPSLLRLNKDYFYKTQAVEPLRSKFDIRETDKEFQEMLDDLVSINESNSQLMNRIPKFLAANFYKRQFTFFKKMPTRGFGISNWTYRELFVLVANELGIAIRNYDIQKYKDQNATLEYFDDKTGMWLNFSDGYFMLPWNEGELDRKTFEYRLKRLEESDKELRSIIKESEAIRENIWTYYSDARDKPLPYDVFSDNYNIEIAYEDYLKFMTYRLEFLRKLEKELIESDTYKAVESLARLFEKLSPEQHEDLLTTLEITDRYKFMKRDIKISNGRNLVVSDRLIFDNYKLAKATVRRFSQFNVGFRHEAKLKLLENGIEIDVDWEQGYERPLFYSDKGYDVDQIITIADDYERAEDAHGRKLILMRLKMQLDIDIRLEGEDEELDEEEIRALDLLQKKRKSIELIESNFNGLEFKVEKSHKEKRWKEALDKLEQERVGASSALVQDARRNSPRIILKEFKSVLADVLKTDILDPTQKQKYLQLYERIADMRTDILSNIFENDHESVIVNLSYVKWAIANDALPKEDKRKYILGHLDGIAQNILGLEKSAGSVETSEVWSLEKKIDKEENIMIVEEQVIKNKRKSLGEIIFDLKNIFQATSAVISALIKKSIIAVKTFFNIQSKNLIIRALPFMAVTAIAAFSCFIASGQSSHAMFLIVPVVVLLRYLKKAKKAFGVTRSLWSNVHKQSPYATLLGSGEKKPLDGIRLTSDLPAKYVTEVEYDKYDYRTNEFSQADNKLERVKTPINVDSLWRHRDLEYEILNFRSKMKSALAVEAPQKNYLQQMTVDLNKLPQTDKYYLIPMPVYGNDYLSIFAGVSGIPFPYSIRNGNVYIEKSMFGGISYSDGRPLTEISLDYFLIPEKLISGNIKSIIDELKIERSEYFEKEAELVEQDLNVDLGLLDTQAIRLKEAGLPDHLVVSKLEQYIRDYLYYAKGSKDLVKLMATPAEYTFEKTLNSRLGVCHDANTLLFMVLNKHGIVAKYMGGHFVNLTKVDGVDHAFIKFWSREKQRWLVADATPNKKFDHDYKSVGRIDVDKLNNYLDPRYVYPRVYSIAEELSQLREATQNIEPEARVIKVDDRIFSRANSGTVNMPVSSDQGRLFYDSKGSLYVELNEGQYYNEIELKYLSVEIETYEKYSVFKTLKRFNDKYYESKKAFDMSIYDINRKDISDAIAEKIDEIAAIRASHARLVKIANDFVGANFKDAHNTNDLGYYELGQALGRKAVRKILFYILKETGVPIRSIKGDSYEYYDEEHKVWVRQSIDINIVENNYKFEIRNYKYNMERTIEHDATLKSIYAEINDLKRNLYPYVSMVEDMLVKGLGIKISPESLNNALIVQRDSLKEMQILVDTENNEFFAKFDAFLKSLSETQCENLMRMLVGKKLDDYKYYLLENGPYKSIHLNYVFDRVKLRDLLIARMVGRLSIYFESTVENDGTIEFRVVRADKDEWRVQGYRQKLTEISALLDKGNSDNQGALDYKYLKTVFDNFNVRIFKAPKTDPESDKVAQLLFESLKTTSYRKTDYYGQDAYVAATKQELMAEKQLEALEQDRVSQGSSSPVGGLDFVDSGYELEIHDNSGFKVNLLQLPKDFEGFTYRVNYSMKLDGPSNINYFLN